MEPEEPTLDQLVHHHNDHEVSTEEIEEDICLTIVGKRVASIRFDDTAILIVMEDGSQLYVAGELTRIRTAPPGASAEPSVVVN